MLISDLTDVKNISMVDRQALEKVLNEQNLNNSNRFDQNTSTKLGKLLGAEVIITGTYFEFFGSLRVDAKFINVETGQILYSVGVDGSREKLLDLRIALANKIVEKIK
jgi:curli biogenesis system outer membrane secretion channel CsgG